MLTPQNSGSLLTRTRIILSTLPDSARFILKKFQSTLLKPKRSGCLQIASYLIGPHFVFYKENPSQTDTIFIIVYSFPKCFPDSQQLRPELSTK